VISQSDVELVLTRAGKVIGVRATDGANFMLATRSSLPFIRTISEAWSRESTPLWPRMRRLLKHRR